MATKGFVFTVYVAAGALLAALTVFQCRIQTVPGLSGGFDQKCDCLPAATAIHLHPIWHEWPSMQ